MILKSVLLGQIERAAAVAEGDPLIEEARRRVAAYARDRIPAFELLFLLVGGDRLAASGDYDGGA